MTVLRCTVGKFTGRTTAVAKGNPSNSVDFFISYATSDEAAAKEIGAILEEAGHSYVAQFRDFVVGTNFVREMQRGLAESSHLIALLSPAYESSHNCRSEWSAAYARDPGSENGGIIQLMIAEVELNPLASQIVYKSLIGLNAADRGAAVLEAIEPWMKGRRRPKTASRGAAAEGVEANPSKFAGAKLGNLPVSIGHLFKGREQFLRQLRESFRRKAAAAITGKAVHGLGGVGKTRAAIEYGHAYAADYAATFFLVGKSESDLKDSLAALAGAAVLDLPEKDLPDLDARLAAVIRWLRTNPGWLLIIDNVDDESAAQAVRHLLDEVGGGGGHVLVTSRVSDWGHVIEPLELDLLTIDAAKDLLLESTPRRTKCADEDAALTRLAKDQLDCLSLALVQAAAYIDERRIGFADYSALFEKEAKKLLAKLGDAAVRNLGYPLPVALTWQASIAKLSDAGRLLLDMLAWLSIEPIPRSLFEIWPDAKTFDLEEALAELTRYNLVHWEAENSAITLHRLVAQVTRDNLDEVGRDRALSALFSWLYVVNPEIHPSDVRGWPRLLPLLPHALVLFDRTCDYGPYPEQPSVYNKYAILLQALARFAEAELLSRGVLRITEAKLGPEHSDVAYALNNLAELLASTNRVAEAEPLYRRALAIVETCHGPDHRFVGFCLNNLAALLKVTNRLAEAEQLYLRAVTIAEANFGSDHPQVATVLSNLGGLLQDTKVEEAESLFRRALAIDEASYGPDHPEVATDANNLAELLASTNRVAEAEPLYRRALAINEASHGPDHPKVGICLNNLARLLRSTDRSAEAEPLFRRAASILLRSSKASGHLLPGTLVMLQNYAVALVDASYTSADAHKRIASVMTEAGFDPAELWPQIFGQDG